MYAPLAKPYNINPALVAPMPEVPKIDAELKALCQKALPGDKGRMAKNAQEFFRRLPKAELHLHSTAMADIFTTARIAWDVSKKTGGGLQKSASFKGSLEKMILDFLHPVQGDLNSYLSRYDLLRSYLIKDLSAIEENSYQGALRSFENGVCLLEIRTSINSGEYGDPRSHLVMKDVAYGPYEELRARIRGFQRAEKDHGGRCKVYLIIVFRRQDDPRNSLALLGQVEKFREKIREEFGRDYIVAVDIGGHEAGHEATRFQEVFRKARERGLKVTVHAGEEPGAGEGSIWDALNSGAQRIGHGTALYRPTPLLPPEVRYESKGFRKNAFVLSLMFGAPYEMCLTSNMTCGAEVTLGYKSGPPGGRPTAVSKVMTEVSEYPARILFALGTLVHQGRSIILPIPCTDGIYTLNTDITREYALAARTFGLGVRDLLAVARYSIRHSFAPAGDKALAFRQWRAFAAHYLFDERYSIADEEAKTALHACRLRLRRELGITSEMVGEIAEEVHRSHKYLRREGDDYLYRRFHRENDGLQF